MENKKMNKVKLEIQDVSQGTMVNHPFFLMLREADGWRKLSVIIGMAEAQAILVAMRGVKFSRPLLHDVYVSTLEKMNVSLEEVVIYKVVDGVYYSLLELRQGEDSYRVEARTSDAVALALRCHAPIYTIESLMQREHIQEGENGAISIPVSSVGIPMLREALERAIKDENYELAAQLRDEIARRGLDVGNEE